MFQLQLIFTIFCASVTFVCSDFTESYRSTKSSHPLQFRETKQPQKVESGRDRMRVDESPHNVPKKSDLISRNGLGNAGSHKSYRSNQRNDRSIDYSFAEYDRSNGGEDFYLSEPDYGDSQGVDTYYFEEIRREQASMGGAGYDEALAAVQGPRKVHHTGDTQLPSKAGAKNVNQIARVAELSTYNKDQGQNVDPITGKPNRAKNGTAQGAKKGHGKGAEKGSGHEKKKGSGHQTKKESEDVARNGTKQAKNGTEHHAKNGTEQKTKGESSQGTEETEKKSPTEAPPKEQKGSKKNKAPKKSSKKKSKTKGKGASSKKKGSHVKKGSGKKKGKSHGSKSNSTKVNGQIESLLSKLNTIIGDLEEKKDKGKLNLGKGMIYPKGNKTGDCTVLNHDTLISGYKGYVNYMSNRVLGALPYIIDGDETFLLHHLSDATKRHNNKVSVELTSKACHCVKAIDVKPVQVDAKRHAIVTAFALEYFNGGWNYIHEDNGKIKEYSVDVWKPSKDHVVDLGRRVYATAFRLFPLDWKRLPWVRVTPLECRR